MSGSVLFAIFAHPDDESFGPSGYLIQRVRAGDDVHVLCVTDGAAGTNDKEVRYDELHAACKVIGATAHQLSFEDGSLSNNLYHELIVELRKCIVDILDGKEACEVSFLTYEKCGLTGHIDHIAVSFATTYLYTHQSEWLLPQHDLGKLRYFCLCDAQKQEDLDYFVYSPKGYPEENVDETADVSDVLEVKIQAIRTHASQQDAVLALSRGRHLLSKEHFLIYQKNSHHIF